MFHNLPQHLLKLTIFPVIGGRTAEIAAEGMGKAAGIVKATLAAHFLNGEFFFLKEQCPRFLHLDGKDEIFGCNPRCALQPAPESLRAHIHFCRHGLAFCQVLRDFARGLAESPEPVRDGRCKKQHLEGDKVDNQARAWSGCLSLKQNVTLAGVNSA